MSLFIDILLFVLLYFSSSQGVILPDRTDLDCGKLWDCRYESCVVAIEVNQIELTA